VCQNAAVCFDNFHYYSGYYGDIKLRKFITIIIIHKITKKYFLCYTCVTYMMRLYKENILVEKEQQNKWKNMKNFFYRKNNNLKKIWEKVVIIIIMKKKCQWNFHLQRNLFMNCLKAMGKTFHPECFVCAYCGKIFANSPFYLEDGLPYCEEDWNELFTTKCVSCGFPIEAGDRWVEALNNNYHSQCFNCTLCKKNLEGKGFFVKAGKPFCKSHARMGIWKK